MRAKTTFWTGTLSALLATALGYVAQRLWGWLFWPDLAAQWSFALVPGPLQTGLIGALGAEAKLLGFYGAMLVQVVGGGLVALSLPRARLRDRAFVVAVLVVLSAWGFRAMSSAVVFPPWTPAIAGTLLTALAYATGYRLFQALAASPVTTTTTGAPKRWTRRRWLYAGGTLVGSALLWPWLRADLNPARRAIVQGAQPLAQNVIDGLRRGQVDFDRLPRVSPWQTPESRFYYVSKNLTPHTVSLERWGALEIGGLVETPQAFSLEQLQALPHAERFNTLQCIDFDPYNPLTDDLVGNGLWTGVALRTLLERANVRPQAQELVLEASDGYSDSLPISAVLERSDILLAWALEGQPLSAKHGYPLRLIVPGQYGMKNVKHVQRLKAVDKDYRGYWQRRGWADDAPNKTYAKIESVQFDQAFALGEAVSLGGWAFAGTRGVSRVEFSVDDGQRWLPAQLEAQRAPATWVRWAALWEPQQSGRFGLIVRAYDGLGDVQNKKRTGSFPSGVSGYHRVWVDVVERASGKARG